MRKAQGIYNILGKYKRTFANSVSSVLSTSNSYDTSDVNDNGNNSNNNGNNNNNKDNKDINSTNNTSSIPNNSTTNNEVENTTASAITRVPGKSRSLSDVGTPPDPLPNGRKHNTMRERGRKDKEREKEKEKENLNILTSSTVLAPELFNISLNK